MDFSDHDSAATGQLSTVIPDELFTRLCYYLPYKSLKKCNAISISHHILIEGTAPFGRRNRLNVHRLHNLYEQHKELWTQKCLSEDILNHQSYNSKKLTSVKRVYERKCAIFYLLELYSRRNRMQFYLSSSCEEINRFLERDFIHSICNEQLIEEICMQGIDMILHIGYKNRVVSSIPMYNFITMEIGSDRICTFAYMGGLDTTDCLRSPNTMSIPKQINHNGEIYHRQRIYFRQGKRCRYMVMEWNKSFSDLAKDTVTEAIFSIRATIFNFHDSGDLNLKEDQFPVSIHVNLNSDAIELPPSGVAAKKLDLAAMDILFPNNNCLNPEHVLVESMSLLKPARDQSFLNEKKHTKLILMSGLTQFRPRRTVQDAQKFSS